ncbi:hypothetical protein [Streptomyces albicerus]|uniref:hypothetical protein n=1 Tax=Streptomyces albicerus TaxID=2569859 RepID=UPI00124B2B3C|nr:hypothetical protein [Streptomyces albicerus]
MNEAWGAVIAGLAAALGAAVAAWATGRAMARQTLTQGREQQRNWLLDQRQQAYAQLLSATDSVRARLRAVIDMQHGPDFGMGGEHDPDEHAQALVWDPVEAALLDADAAVRRIAIVGPADDTQALAKDVREALQAVVDSRTEYEQRPSTMDACHLAAEQVFKTAEAAFVTKAQWVLHSDEL